MRKIFMVEKNEVARLEINFEMIAVLHVSEFSLDFFLLAAYKERAIWSPTNRNSRGVIQSRCMFFFYFFFLRKKDWSLARTSSRDLSREICLEDISLSDFRFATSSPAICRGVRLREIRF